MGQVKTLSFEASIQLSDVNVAVPADTASQAEPTYTELLFAGRRACRNRRELDKFDLQQLPPSADPSSDQLTPLLIQALTY